MGSLGRFGVDRPANESTFDYFEATLRVHPDLSEIAIVDLFDLMGGVADLDENDPKAASVAIDAIRKVGEVLVHPGDVAEFWRLTRAHRQTMEDVAGLAMALLSALTERPTRRPSDSSAGPQPTGTTSGDGSALPALRLLEGRPDLQVAVLQASEARTA